MVFSSELQPSQIVCLEDGGDRLYAEVIQIVKPRQLAWVRPLMLVIAEPELSSSLYDLRQGSDLLWPAKLFRAALDTEVISLLSQLDAPPIKFEGSRVGHQQLKRFIDRVWQAHKRNIELI